jgi:hypothetical protein
MYKDVQTLFMGIFCILSEIMHNNSFFLSFSDYYAENVTFLF